MSTVVCAGGGKIGRQATLYALKRGAAVLVIDSDQNCPARSLCDTSTESKNFDQPRPGRAIFVQGNGISVLLDILRRTTPELVVPAMQGHLAAWLAVEHCRSRGRMLTPSDEMLPPLLRDLPAGIVMLCDPRHGVIVTSYMPQDRRCMDGCPRPPECPVTGRPIPVPMHHLMGEALSRTVVQWAVLATSGSEVGGIAGKDLQAMLSMLDRLKDRETVGIATSCDCHGMINLFRLQDERHQSYTRLSDVSY